MILFSYKIVSLVMIKKLLSSRPLRFSTYAHKMREAWQTDPTLVHEDWDKYFKSGSHSQSFSNISETDELRAKELALSAYFLIRYYKMRGHEIANIDPLSTLHIT